MVAPEASILPQFHVLGRPVACLVFSLCFCCLSGFLFAAFFLSEVVKIFFLFYCSACRGSVSAFFGSLRSLFSRKLYVICNPDVYSLWRESGYVQRQYHDDRGKDYNGAHLTEASEQQLAENSSDSAAAHKVADVEVAGFLSGGVDSAYITALARPGRTYTISYAEPRYDESFPARALARSLGVRNRVRRISPGEFWDAVPAVQYHMDEPLADAAAVALYFLNREAAREVKVCLSGEGADELFGGYNIYRDPFTARWYDRLPPWLRGGLGAAASLLPPGPGVNFLVRRGCPVEERYFGPTALMTEREKRRLLADYEGDGDPMFLTEALWDSTEGLDPVSRMQQVDINLWLAGDILLKADKMSMAHSLELRVPFLDKEVFALAAALPAAAKANARMTKIALRQAAARTLPPASAARKKLGFPVPVRDWLRQEPYTSRVRAVFSRPAAAEFFDPRALHSMLNQHLHGGDCWRQIWCVYSFLIWYEQFFGA